VRLACGGVSSLCVAAQCHDATPKTSRLAGSGSEAGASFRLLLIRIELPLGIIAFPFECPGDVPWADRADESLSVVATPSLRLSRVAEKDIDLVVIRRRRHRQRLRRDDVRAGVGLQDGRRLTIAAVSFEAVPLRSKSVYSKKCRSSGSERLVRNPDLFSEIRVEASCGSSDEAVFHFDSQRGVLVGELAVLAASEARHRAAEIVSIDDSGPEAPIRYQNHR